MTSAPEGFPVTAEPAGGIRRLLDARFGPLALALVLALASTPIAAIGIIVSTMSPDIQYYPLPPLDVDLALAMALLAVVTGGLAGGAIAGARVRRHPVGGLFLAGLIAWPAAVATLPLVSGLLGRPFAAVLICVDSCSPLIKGSALESGLTSYLGSLFLGVFGPLEVGVVLALAAWVAVDRGHRRSAAVLGLGAVVSFNLVSMAAAVPAAVALVGGTILWTAAFWPRSAPRPDDRAWPSPDPTPDPTSDPSRWARPTGA